MSVQRNTDPIFKDFDVMVDGTKYRPFDFLRILRNTKDGAEGTPITVESSKLIEVAYQSLCFELYLVKKGGNKKGFLKSEKPLTAEAMATLRTAYSNLYSNTSDNVVVLNKGIDFQESSNTSVEMQLNENKVTNAAEFSKIFHIWLPLGLCTRSSERPSRQHSPTRVMTQKTPRGRLLGLARNPKGSCPSRNNGRTI